MTGGFSPPSPGDIITGLNPGKTHTVYTENGSVFRHSSNVQPNDKNAAAFARMAVHAATEHLDEVSFVYRGNKNPDGSRYMPHEKDYETAHATAFHGGLLALRDMGLINYNFMVSQKDKPFFDRLQGSVEQIRQNVKSDPSIKEMVDVATRKRDQATQPALFDNIVY
jgi:hypothetical protein